MDNLSQFLAEMPPLESLSKQELVERVQEAERKWLEEQRINMELVYEMETDVQEQKVTTLRQRVQELETQLTKNNPLLDEAADAIDKLTAERDALMKQRDELVAAIENCRLLAARHRKEGWATHILRFCVESGVIGSPIRDTDIASVKEKS